MKNNLHEDKDFNDKLKDFHTLSIQNLSLPKWILELECPFCHQKLTSYSIRGIVFKTNPRNIGDVSVEFMCENCKCGDSLYIRKVFDDSKDIANIINGEKDVDPKTAVIEEKMYKQMYNNSLEKMLGGSNGNS